MTDDSSPEASAIDGVTTVPLDALELDAVTQSDDAGAWLAGFPFSPDRPGETVGAAADYTVVYNELEPGNRIGRHRDGVDEVVLVLEGEVEASAEGETTRLAANTLTVVPAGVDHAVENVGSTTARLVGFFPAAPVESSFDAPLNPDEES